MALCGYLCRERICLLCLRCVKLSLCLGSAPVFSHQRFLACCLSFGSLPDVSIGCQTRCEMVVPNFGHHHAKNMVPRTFGDLSSRPGGTAHSVQGVLGTTVILLKNSSHSRSIFISFSLSFQPCHMKEHARFIQDLWREACQLRVVGDGFLLFVFFFSFFTRFPPFHPPPSAANQG